VKPTDCVIFDTCRDFGDLSVASGGNFLRILCRVAYPLIASENVFDAFCFSADLLSWSMTCLIAARSLGVAGSGQLLIVGVLPAEFGLSPDGKSVFVRRLIATSAC
jgi:hypothetical protein